MLEEVHGQNDGVRLLQRVVDGKLAVPLLLVGPEGTGRRFSVLQAAKQLVGDDEAQVYQVAHGQHPDVTIVEPEQGKDIKVEATRSLLEKAKFQPSRAPLRFLVVDGIDCVTPAASNALLKVLEEAPESVRFFLLAEREEKVLPTIRSRCSMVRYRRLPEDFIEKRLRAHTEDGTRSLVCSRLSEGSLGRASRLLNSGRLALRDEMLRLLDHGRRGDLKALFTAVDSAGKDLPLGLRFLEHILHDLTMLPHDPTRISNLDKLSELTQFRDQVGQEKIETLRQGLRVVQRRLESGPINPTFHVKTLLATAF
jgi:DNA polymerase-3 subunit delta'